MLRHVCSLGNEADVGHFRPTFTTKLHKNAYYTPIRPQNNDLPYQGLTWVPLMWLWVIIKPIKANFDGSNLQK